MPYITPASPQPATAEPLATVPHVALPQAEPFVGADAYVPSDHLAIEEERGANCARIRELMASQRAGAFEPALTDEAREAAIKLAASAVERHMADYERTGDFACRGNADRARLAMEALIAGRKHK